MKNKIENTDQRTWLLRHSLFTQSFILLLSVLWINISPKDNVLKYFIKFNFQLFLKGLLTGLGLALAGYIFYLFAKKIKMLHSAVELFEKILAPLYNSLKIPDIFFLSFVAAFCEETFFRGLILTNFGLIISSITFGIVHLPGTKYWIYALWATLSGALLGWLFMLTGSLWLPILAHAINNIIGMFMLKKLFR